MHSSMPKVLHTLAGKPILLHLLQTCLKVEPTRIHIVVGHGREQIIRAFHPVLQSWPAPQSAIINWVEQEEQLGTGHAASLAAGHLKDESRVLILNGDVPLLSAATLQRVIPDPGSVRLVTVVMADPSGLGRILRNDAGEITGIVEERDASPEEKSIREVNVNCLGAEALRLRRWLTALDNDNAQGEYYLTDTIASAAREGIPMVGITPADADEGLGANTRSELARLERAYQYRQAMAVMDHGVTLLDPNRFDVRGTCRFGNDCSVDVNVILEGRVEVGDNVCIGPNTVIRDSSIGYGCRIEANSVIENAVIGHECRIGPFARIRSGTVLDDRARIGNFVETKNSSIGMNSKAGHLAYIGDSKVGRNANIGAGVITCNYDGKNKHRTMIGDNVFIGSDSQLVAPVHIADGATIAAGSTITRDVDIDCLASSRVPQKSIRNWKRPGYKT